ncbi:UNVERIFIED_CONTAM: hypothetical protein HDU68_007293 [Siphonaria sp. JEL0065]|nr:hypothetical protein HDU68_007293 [Siphonaria sp. JEL0065]
MQVLSVAIRYLPTQRESERERETKKQKQTLKQLTRPPSASLLLLEQIHGATKASATDLCDAFFVLAIQNLTTTANHELFRSAIVSASLNPFWDLAGLPFPKLSRSNTDLTLNLWTRPAGSSTIDFSLSLSVPFNPLQMSFIGKQLTAVDRSQFTELILVELPDGFYKLDSTSVASNNSQSNMDADLADDDDEVRDSYDLAGLQKLNVLRDASRRRASYLKSEIKLKSKMLDIEKSKIAELRRDIQRRKNRLYYSSKDREQCQQGLLSAEEALNDLGTIVYETTKFTNVSGKSFITDLKEIYPINTLREDPNAYFIRRIWLPHSEFVGVDEERTATALGWTAHAVTLIALFLEIPLRYPINPMSSRSMILDRIYQHTSMNMEFPLFMKGSEKPRFEYGVFLLNKNIEQLLNHVGFTVKNLRNTLPNLKLLIDSLAKADINPGHTFNHAAIRVIDPPSILEPEIHVSLASLTQQNSRDLLFAKLGGPQAGDYLDGSDYENESEVNRPESENVNESLREGDAKEVIEDEPQVQVTPTGDLLPLPQQHAEEPSSETTGETYGLFQMQPLEKLCISPNSVSLLERGLTSPRSDSNTDKPSNSSASPHSDTDTAKPCSSSIDGDTVTPRISSTPEPQRSITPFKQPIPIHESPASTQSLTFTFVNTKSISKTSTIKQSSYGPESNLDFSTSSPPIRILSKGTSPASILIASKSPSLSLRQNGVSQSLDSGQQPRSYNSDTVKKSILELLQQLPDNSDEDDDNNSDSDSSSSEDEEEQDRIMNGVLQEMSIDIPKRSPHHLHSLPPFPHHLSPSAHSIASSESSSDNFRTPTTGMSPVRGLSRGSMDSDTFVNNDGVDGGASVGGPVVALGSSVSGSVAAARPASSMLGTLGWMSLQQPLSIAGSMFFNPFNVRATGDTVGESISRDEEDSVAAFEDDGIFANDDT